LAFTHMLSGSPPESHSQDTYGKNPSDWNVTIYPVYAWAPIFGASVNLPTFPELPGGGGIHPGGKVSGSFNGAVFAGYLIEKSKWSTSGAFLWAGLSGEQSNPHVKVNLDVLYGQVLGGREILPNLTLEGGVRRMALKITAEVGEFPSVRRKPGVWDPLVGLSYRKRLGPEVAAAPPWRWRRLWRR
jgi:hypothetical protein